MSVVVSPGRELQRVAGSGVDTEELVPRVLSIAECVAAIVGVANHRGSRAVPLAAMRVDVDRCNDARPVGQPVEACDRVRQVGELARLAAVGGQQPDLTRRAGLVGAGAEKREHRAVGRPGWRGIRPAGGQTSTVAAFEWGALDPRHALAVLDLAADKGHNGAIGRDCRRSDDSQFVDDVWADGRCHGCFLSRSWTVGCRRHSQCEDRVGFRRRVDRFRSRIFFLGHNWA